MNDQPKAIPRPHIGLDMALWYRTHRRGTTLRKFMCEVFGANRDDNVMAWYLARM